MLSECNWTPYPRTSEVQTNSSRTYSLVGSCRCLRSCLWGQQLHLSVLYEPISDILPLYWLADIQLVYSANVFLLRNDLPHSISNWPRRLVHLSNLALSTLSFLIVSTFGNQFTSLYPRYILWQLFLWVIMHIESLSHTQLNHF